jgi:hypothetical protein
MYTKHKLVSSAILIACGTMGTQAHAAFPADAVLNFTDSVYGCWINNTLTANSPTLVGSTWTCPNSSEVAAPLSTSSYFAMDLSGNSKLAGAERIGMQNNQGIRLTIGSYPNVTQLASGSHAGFPNGNETPSIDAPWAFYGNTGMHLTQSPVTVASNNNAGTVTLEFAGWKVAWNGIEDGNASFLYIPMGGCALNGVQYCAGGTDIDAGTTSSLTCYSDAGRTTIADCSLGSYFLLSHSAHVPLGDPSGFGGVLYGLQLVGQIGGFNTPPTAGSFSIQVQSSNTANINLLTHVTNSDGIGSIDATSVVISNDGSCGTVTDNNDGTVTVPSCGASTYTFDYTISDGYETSSAGTVTVQVVADPIPLSVADSATTDGVTPVIIDVLSNDSDAGAGGGIDATSVAIATAASHGNTSINATTGAITYTADAGFAGTDTFTYTVDDGVPQTSAAATVTVTVNAYNAPASSATFAVGSIASAAGSTSGIVTMTQIGTPDTGTYPEDDIAQSCIGGCFDFVLSGVTPGASASVVLPLSTAIPAPAAGNFIKYRKLINGSWRDFDITTDTMQSAAGTVNGSNVSCPPAGDSSYHGLTTGDRCLLLTITDGGANDADGTANGSIADPGGLGEITRASGSDGCSMTGNNSAARDHTDWLLLAGFISMLGWFGIRRRKA